MNKEMKTSSSKKKNEPKIFVSKPLVLDIKKLAHSFYRADLEFWGIDYSGPSYEGRVFINNSKANSKTRMTIKNGYVGSYFIFGHGKCFGDIGHCEIRKEKDPYDLRPAHPLTPAYTYITITDQLIKIGKNTTEFVVTIVPALSSGTIADDEEDVIKLDKIQIITYNK